MEALIKELDEALQDFIQGRTIVANYQQYNALEQVSLIINKHRRPATVKVQSYDLED